MDPTSESGVGHGKLTGLPTTITTPVTINHIEAYLLHMSMEESIRKSRIDNIVLSAARRCIPLCLAQHDVLGRSVRTRQRGHHHTIADYQELLSFFYSCDIHLGAWPHQKKIILKRHYSVVYIQDPLHNLCLSTLPLFQRWKKDRHKRPFS